MTHLFVPSKKILALTLSSLMLAACGGGGGSDSTSSNTTGSSTSSSTSNTGTGSTGTTSGSTNTSGSSSTISSEVTSYNGVNKNFADVGGSVDSTTGLNTVEQVAFNALNVARSQCGFGVLTTNTELQKSADNHANYLAYHAMTNSAANYTNPSYVHATHGHNELDTTSPFYSANTIAARLKTDSSKGVLADAVLYNWRFVTENLTLMTIPSTTIDATYDSRAATHGMRNLLAAPYHMAGLLENKYKELGLSYRRSTMTSSTGAKLPHSVLEVMSASQTTATVPTVNGTVHYPCNGITDTAYELTNEAPNPIPNRNLATNPIGQPVFIQSTVGSTLAITAYSMKDAQGNIVTLSLLNKNNDPNGLVVTHQAILMPLTKLNPSTTYTVSYTATVNGVSVGTKTFSFKTTANQTLLNKV